MLSLSPRLTGNTDAFTRLARQLVAVFALIAITALSALAPTTADAETVRSGEISGQSDHVMRGTITIERDGDRTYVVLSEEFFLDGAPDPKLGFGNGEAFDTDTIFAALEANTGAQRYEVPASIDVAAYDTFTVWCEQFSVPLGSASLN